MQEIKHTTKNTVKRAGSVLPKEDTVIYSTDAISSIMPVGSEMTVHAELAKKLIASGKATTNRPAPVVADLKPKDKEKEGNTK